MREETQQLQQLFSALPAEIRRQLLDYAEFLHQRHAVTEPLEIPAPEEIPRPEGESVVAALKRLSRSYHMVDRTRLLHESSRLMSEHVMQGRAAPGVIDELERLFRNEYESLIAGQAER